MIKMYGIPNCDTVKKAAAWFRKNDIAFELHDYKKQAVSASKLKEWSQLKGWETIFNKRSTTWKEIMNESVVTNQAEAIKLMQHHTSIIKRPIIEMKEDIIVGYDEKAYIEKILNRS